jgi:hypothetical protein
VEGSFGEEALNLSSDRLLDDDDDDNIHNLIRAKIFFLENRKSAAGMY